MGIYKGRVNRKRRKHYYEPGLVPWHQECLPVPPKPLKKDATEREHGLYQQAENLYRRLVKSFYRERELAAVPVLPEPPPAGSPELVQKCYEHAARVYARRVTRDRQDQEARQVAKNRVLQVPRPPIYGSGQKVGMGQQRYRIAMMKYMNKMTERGHPIPELAQMQWEELQEAA